VQQPKPALVAELREAVATCDEELQKLKARAGARAWHTRTRITHAAADGLRVCHLPRNAQTSKDYLEGQAQEIEKNIKELLKTNDALARQILQQ
jgi:hypothetical protein